MIAFAGNSILCRLALGSGSIDVASFTAVRILSGAVVLLLLVAVQQRSLRIGRPRIGAVLALFLYMICFSFAYLSLSAGTGALLLFGAVQITMLGVALIYGERFSATAWAGLVLAFCGLIYLVAPGVAAPDPAGAVLMVIAGIAWGAYSLLGRGASDPLLETARNFVYCVPFAVVVFALMLSDMDITATGLVLAIASGALASGVGYAIWYAALPALSAGNAATVQLSVPVIAALGGVIFIAETFSIRIGVATLLTIGGIWLVLAQRETKEER